MSSSVEDVIVNKVATIERCVRRAREEYFSDPDTFATNMTRQDAAILNIQRACEAAIDLGNILIRRRHLGIPQSSRDVFDLIERGKIITSEMAEKLKKMVGYRNIAVHDYQTLQLPITVEVVKNHLSEIAAFGSLILRNHTTQ